MNFIAQQHRRALQKLEAALESTEAPSTPWGRAKLLRAEGVSVPILCKECAQGVPPERVGKSPSCAECKFLTARQLRHRNAFAK